MKPLPIMGVILGLLAAAPAPAADAARSQIEQQRRAAEDRYAAELVQCRERFAVNACIDDVKTRRRAELTALRRQELALDDAERHRRAAERRETIERRQAELDARPQAASAPATVLRAPRSASAAAARLHAASGADPGKAEDAARRARAAQRMREDAEATRQKIREREELREKSGKAAAPLPVPASAPR